MVPHNLAARATGKTIPLTPLTEEGLDAWLEKAGTATAAWVEAAGFDAGAGETLLLPAERRAVRGALGHRGR